MRVFYDEIGNLIADKSENITNIVWSIYGKVLKVEKQSSQQLTIIEYLYDAKGNRVKKTVKVNPIGMATTFSTLAGLRLARPATNVPIFAHVL